MKNVIVLVLRKPLKEKVKIETGRLFKKIIMRFEKRDDLRRVTPARRFYLFGKAQVKLANSGMVLIRTKCNLSSH